MENSTLHTPEQAHQNTGTPNGAAESPPNPNQSGAAQQEAMQRAEEMVDRFAEQVSHAVSTLGRSFLKWVARAREEAEDIWAEAQEMREKQKAPSQHTASTGT